MRFVLALASLLLLAACGRDGLSIGGGEDDPGVDAGVFIPDGFIAPDGLPAIVDLARPIDRPWDLAAGPRDLAVPRDLSGPRDLAVSRDLAAPRDMARPGIPCGNQLCAPDLLCCVGADGTSSCQRSCPDAGISIGCVGPQSCGGDPCCATIDERLSGTVSCGASPAACPPAIDFGNRSALTRLCRGPADCTAGAPNAMLRDCCAGAFNGVMTRFCFSRALAGMVPGIACP